MLQRLSLRTLALVALMTMPSQALDLDCEGNVELELRHFPNPARHQDMEDNSASLAAEIELGLFSPSGRHAIIIKPFARYDQYDHERSHGDLREAKYRYVNGAFEATIGIDKEFWGVTEFLHLVDIINQTDNVESIDGEQKLGQAMVKFSYASRFGTLSAYSLPFFRSDNIMIPKPDGPMPALLSMTIPAILKAAKDGAPMIMRCAIKIILARLILACLGLTARRANRNWCCPSRPKPADCPMACPYCKRITPICSRPVLMCRPLWGPGF